MRFMYQQTVVFECSGWLRIDVRSDDETPISPSDLAFVLGLAQRCAQFESDRLLRKARTAAAQRAAMPLCWPGFRPPHAQQMLAREASYNGHTVKSEHPIV